MGEFEDGRRGSGVTEFRPEADAQDLEIRVLEIVQSLLNGEQVTAHTCLLGPQGILDSFTTVAMIAELEHVFKVDIDDEDLTLDNLADAAHIVNLLRDKLYEGEQNK